MPWLPERLPDSPRVLWRVPLAGKGLGGVAATADCVLVSGRELNDTTDATTCLRADTGKEVWKHLVPAPGQLDFGNSPRATPLIHAGRVFVAGAFGYLAALDLATGEPAWEMDLREEFAVKDVRKWGHCSSPLVVDGRLIVNPGGPQASLVALEPATGKVLWRSPGAPASYGNLVAARVGGRTQVVGFDLESLGGWDPATGKRLWKVVLPKPSQFNVPTPIVVGEDRLLVSVDNSGTLLYRFRADGTLDPRPEATYARLAPDTHTPVVAAGRVFGAWNGLHALDLAKGLQPVWVKQEAAFNGYLALVATDERVLAVTAAAELILFDARADRFEPRGRVAALADEQGCYAHPALVGSRLYLRGERELLALDLAP